MLPRIYWKLSIVVLGTLAAMFLAWSVFYKNESGIGSPESIRVSGEDNDAIANLSSTNDAEKAVSYALNKTALKSQEHERFLKLYTCQKVDFCSDIVTASSEAEGRWLADSGYPTPTQLDSYKAMPLGAIEAAAKSSPAMRALYGERLLDLGKQVEASEQIRLSIAQGSIYGLYKLADVYNRDGILKDEISSLAALRLAYIMGDRKASDELYRRSNGLSLIDYKLIDTQAMTLYKRILTERYKVMGYGIRVTPRP